MTFKKYFYKRNRKLIKENISNNKVLIKDLYPEGFPDDDEIFWDYVSGSDLKQQFTVQTIQPREIESLFFRQYERDNIKDILKMLSSKQKSIVNHYRKDNNLKDTIIIIVRGQCVVDGNHRALAALLNNVPIQAIDLAEF